MRSISIRRPLALAAVLSLAAGIASAQERWFHVRVTESGDDAVSVALNLPLSLIESALAVIPDEINAEVSAELNEMGVELEELRQFWADAKDMEDALFVTVESAEETVHIVKEGDYLIAKTVQSGPDGAEVNVRLPFDVLTALFNEEKVVDLPAAIRAIAEHSDGDLVTVRDGTTHVRIWVDDENEPTV